MKLIFVLTLSVLLCTTHAISSASIPTSTSATAIENDASALLDPNVKIDPKLRKALLRVLTDLENQDDDGSDASKENPDHAGAPGELKKVFNVHAFSADTSKQITDVSLLVPKPSETTDSSKTSPQPGKPSKSTSKNEIPQEPSKYFVTPHETIKAPTPTAETSFQSDEANAKVEEVQFFPAPLVAAFTVHQDAQGLPRSVIPLYKDEERKTNDKIVDAKGLFQRVAPLLSENSKGKKVETQNNTKSNVLDAEASLDEKRRVLEEQFRILQEQQRQQEQFLRQQQLYHEEQILAARKRQHELEEQRRIQQLRFDEEKRRQQLIKNSQSVRGNTIVSLLPSISIQQPPQVNNQQTFNPNSNFPTSFFNQQLPNREAVDFLTNLRLQNLHELPLQQNHIPLNFDQALPPQQQINFIPSAQNQGTRNLRQEIGTGNFGLNQQFQSQISPLQDFTSASQQPQTIRHFRQEFGTGNFGFNQPLSSFHSQISPVFDLTSPSISNRNLNRNLRQETQTANAGINRSNLQSFINNDPIILSQVGGSSNRVFRQPNTNNFGLDRQNQIYTADRQLKNLLYQSGIVQGRNEDLNIVSKVLSLNHFGGDLSGEIRRSDHGTTFYFKNK